jgi:hypothetical protein
MAFANGTHRLVVKTSMASLIAKVTASRENMVANAKFRG